jgi:hypothetical protein
MRASPDGLNFIRFSKKIVRESLLNVLKIVAVVVTGMTLASCKTIPPTYSYTAASPADPEISFESDFDLHTFFSVSTKFPQEKSCTNFDTVGYLLKPESVFIYDKANHQIVIRAAAEKPLAVSANHLYSDPSYRGSCGPLTRLFIPSAGKKYVVKMNKNPKSTLCYVSVFSKEPDGGRTEVSSTALPNCVKEPRVSQPTFR